MNVPAVIVVPGRLSDVSSRGLGSTLREYLREIPPRFGENTALDARIEKFGASTLAGKRLRSEQAEGLEPNGHCLLADLEHVR